jgi:hypothetical protein
MAVTISQSCKICHFLNIPEADPLHKWEDCPNRKSMRDKVLHSLEHDKELPSESGESGEWTVAKRRQGWSMSARCTYCKNFGHVESFMKKISKMPENPPVEYIVCPQRLADERRLHVCKKDDDHDDEGKPKKKQEEPKKQEKEKEKTVTSCPECRYTDGNHRAWCSRGYCKYCAESGHIESFFTKCKSKSGEMFEQIVCPVRAAHEKINRSASLRAGKSVLVDQKCLFCKGGDHVFYVWLPDYCESGAPSRSRSRRKVYCCPEYQALQCRACGEIGHTKRDHCSLCGLVGHTSRVCFG